VGKYTLQSWNAEDFAAHVPPLTFGHLGVNAWPADRQRVIDALVRGHGMPLAATKSVRYDASLVARDAVNEDGVIRVGPAAFLQGRPWLACVIFRELVRSDQLRFRARHGVSSSADAAASEPLRLMQAVDAFEALYWPWRNSLQLGLGGGHVADLARGLGQWQAKIDDAATKALARAGRFDEARLALVERLPAPRRRPRILRAALGRFVERFRRAAVA
jgi:hypothetical protein